MLVLDVLWLSAAYEAEVEGRAEWPPHPARAFSALVSVAEPGSDDDAALRWLERLPAPRVEAPVATSARRHAYVVTNAVDPKKDKHQTHLGRTSGSHEWQRSLPVRPFARLIWPDAAPTTAVATLLDALARRVPYLGRSTSPVLMSVHGTAPIESEHLQTYVPDPSGHHRMRVPSPGYLGVLREAFEDRLLDHPRARVIAYRNLAEKPLVVSHEPVAPAPWPHLVTLGFDAGTAVDGRHAVAVASAFKAALLSRLGRPVPGDDWEPLAPESLDLLHGHYAHAEDPRRQCAVIALPIVGHRRASGNILGVGIAVSPHLETQVLGPLLRLLGFDRDPAEGPRLSSLRLRGVGSLTLRRADGRTSINPDHWARADKRWDTVLPIVLDRFPRRSYTLADAVADGCEWAGLGRPEHVELRPASAVPGAPHLAPSQLRRSDGPPRPAVHATLHFRRPVRGPVLIGHLRHLGVGLCLPAASRRSAA